MKSFTFFSVAVLALGVYAVAPTDTAALSCATPDMMLELYTTDDDYSIFTGQAGDTVEYVKEAAKPDLMEQYDSGYTGQFVTVETPHKGYVTSEMYVYYTKNSTWGYMCAGAPAEAGTTELYIVHKDNNDFSLPTVAATYDLDSDFAIELLKALEDEEVTGDVDDATRSDMVARLRTLIEDGIFVLKIRLNEIKLLLAK